MILVPLEQRQHRSCEVLELDDARVGLELRPVVAAADAGE